MGRYIERENYSNLGPVQERNKSYEGDFNVENSVNQDSGRLLLRKTNKGKEIEINENPTCFHY